MARKKKKGSRSKAGPRVSSRAPAKRRVASPSPSIRGSSKSRTRVFDTRNARASRAPRTIKRKLPLKTRVKLKEGLALLRKHIHGYTAQDGYDAGRLDTWDSKKRRRLLRRAAKLKELTATPHDTIKARTRKERKNLHRFTSQKIRNAKHYIVHKPADNFRARLVKGNIEVEGRFPGGIKTRSRFFLFPRRPKYPGELVSMARSLQKEMPLGFYTVLTAAHGDTGEPFERDEIINRLNEYLAAYEVDQEGNPTGFSEALIGFRFMSTTLGGAITQRRHIDARRQRQKAFNEKKHKENLRKEQHRCEARTQVGKRCRNKAVGKFAGRYLCARHKPK